MIIGRRSRRIALGLVLGMVVGEGCVGFAAENVNEGTISQEMQVEIIEAQKPENQAAYDAYYQSVIGSVSSQAIADILRDKAALIDAVYREMELNKDNQVAVEALNQALILLQNENNTNGFSTEIQGVPKSAASSAADQVALTASMKTLSSELSSVQKEIDITNQKLDLLRLQSINYIQSYPASILRYNSMMPNVVDGSPATVYGIDPTNVYYFVDAGIWSDVGLGQKYGIIDDDGNGVGHIEIVLCMNDYSVGILSRCNDIYKGYKVAGLFTRKTPPNNDN